MILRRGLFRKIMNILWIATYVSILVVIYGLIDFNIFQWKLVLNGNTTLEFL